MNAPLSVDNVWVGATANPPKSDDWKWSTDRGAFINISFSWSQFRKSWNLSY